MVDPVGAAQNYAALAKLGAEGRYGFYEAIDFTPTRVPSGETQAIVRAALTALKGPLGNEKAFRNKIQSILNDPAQRNRLVNELGLKKEE